MKVEQVYTIVNNLTKEFIGETAVVEEDLRNIVDIGSETINLQNLDRYVNALIDHIGKVVFVNRPYSGATPSILMDGWEYGAILEKIAYKDLPTATENESWELEDGKEYNPNIFTQPKVGAKFFSKKVTFEIPMSFARRQVESAFDNATQLNSFFSMIYTAIETSMTVKIDDLAMRTINTMIANTLSSNSGIRAINLLTGYNAETGGTLTAEKCVSDPDFIRYASYIMNLFSKRLNRLTTLFNGEGNARHTPNDRLHIILLSEFAAAAETYLYSDTYNDEYVFLPRAEVVPFWQGSGTDYAFTSTSLVHGKFNNGTTDGVSVNQSGILGVMFDRYTLGIANLDRRVTTQWNAKAEFYNNWYKFDAGYFFDNGENAIVFYVGDSE